MTERESGSQKIIRRHYGLDRVVTFEEVQAEIEMLKRRGPANCDDSQLSLGSKLGLWPYQPIDSYLADR